MRPVPPQDIKLFSSSVFPASDLTESIISRLTYHFFFCWVCFHWVFHPTSRSWAPFTYHFSFSDPSLSRALRNQTRWKRRAFDSPLNDSSLAGGQLDVLSRYFYKQPGMWDRSHVLRRLVSVKLWFCTYSPKVRGCFSDSFHGSQVRRTPPTTTPSIGSSSIIAPFNEVISRHMGADVAKKNTLWRDCDRCAPPRHDRWIIWRDGIGITTRIMWRQLSPWRLGSRRVGSRLISGGGGEAN